MAVDGEPEITGLPLTAVATAGCAGLWKQALWVNATTSMTADGYFNGLSALVAPRSGRTVSGPQESVSNHGSAIGDSLGVKRISGVNAPVGRQGR
jgi:hypothetical protein